MSSTASVVCPQCSAELSSEGIFPGDTVLCARCGAVAARLRKVDPRRISRLAVCSLVLGLAAPVFSCAAGLPAVLLGCLALLRMRHRHEVLKGRALAITGIATGGLFGVLCGPIVAAAVLGVIRQAGESQRQRAAAEVARDAARAAEIAARLGRFQVPQGLALVEGSEGPAPGCLRVVLEGHSPSGSVLIVLAKVSLDLPNAQQVVNSLIFERALALRIDARRQWEVSCLVAGQPGTVAGNAGPGWADQKPRRNYVGMYERGGSLLGVLVSTSDEPPRGTAPTAPGGPSVSLAEEEVRAFLASIELPPAAATDQATGAP